MTTADGSTTADLLETIVAATRRIVEVREAREPMGDLLQRAERRPALTSPTGAPYA